MGLLTQYMVHGTDTAPWVKVNKATLFRWHMAPRKNTDGTFTYRGINYTDLSDIDLPPIHERYFGRGWDRYGYHKLIHRDGKVEIITPVGKDAFLSNDEMTWGCSGQNSRSIHVALVGGRLQDNKTLKKHVDFFKIYTYQQFLALQKDIKQTLAKYDAVKVTGHYNYSKKMCPFFDVKDLAELFGLEMYFL